MGNIKRRGAREYELLSQLEINGNDMLVGFLLSACSTHRMYKIAQESAQHRALHQRKKSEERYRMKKRLRQLEKEGYVRLVGSGEKQVVKMTQQGTRAVRWRNIEVQTKGKTQTGAWDGQWTIVFFDVPQQEKHIRYTLSSLLRRCGFHQTQMSVYVYPYDCPELIQALGDFPAWGRYCQIVRGTYCGDDSRLRNKFDL